MGNNAVLKNPQIQQSTTLGEIVDILVVPESTWPGRGNCIDFRIFIFNNSDFTETYAIEHVEPNSGIYFKPTFTLSPKEPMNILSGFVGTLLDPITEWNFNIILKRITPSGEVVDDQRIRTVRRFPGNPPKAFFSDIITIPEAKPGDVITLVKGSINNPHPTFKWIWLMSLKDIDTHTNLTVKKIIVNANSKTDFSIIATMPNKDFNLSLVLNRLTPSVALNGSAPIVSCLSGLNDDSINFTIKKISVPIPTIPNISAFILPSLAFVGGIFAARLLRNRKK